MNLSNITSNTPMPNIGPDREIHSDRAAATAFTQADYHAIWEKWASEAIPGANEQRGQAVARMKECLENNADKLNLHNLDLTSLPDTLPPCNELEISNNNITELPTLPNNLQRLMAICNQLRTLPDTLPEHLLSLYVISNKLERLPENLPESLNTLNVCDNPSLQFPNNWPSNLMYLNIADCELTELPTLPNTLTELYADFNQLRTLPDTLPTSLLKLSVTSNQFTQLPETLPASLSFLMVLGNSLTALPENLPSSLSCIGAEYNQFSQLPDLARLPQNCELLLEGNPLSASTLLALQHLRTNPYYQGPQIICRELDDLPPASLSNIVAIWLVPEQQNTLAGDWANIETEANSAAFSVFLHRLATTKNTENIPEFKQQIAAWLLQLAGSPTLREQTFLIAQEASATCEDRITLTYNDMQKAVMLHEVEKGQYDTQLPELMARGREMFRLEQLENIAREKVKILKTLNVHSVDDIEVYLAYQVKLRESLELFSVSKEMRFFGVSHVTTDDLLSAEARVKTAENHDFPRWLSQWSPWKSVGQRIEPERYAAAVEKQYHALENIYPDKLAAELAANGMTGDVDANRIVGKRINDELMGEIDIALTLEVLSAKGASSLLDNLWMESLISP
ncbi:NEL-type E3 ubiquitin ligase domain-containing protein [Yersinia pseudotuberculosis]|uniref:NEL-type E3 ubiquitin ligase domain-containing protein n=1 Tax=Yersinia pseudotuberculosis TaxID=633 RepID=UPI0005E52D14|nr:NEL-type E3 ubiquitin ligase domain-containing protein [Yersinia pseudotuberculosis]CNM12533.1 putative antigenic leucine-rich repeat protein [Yersinia pseudotuberculosis]